MGHSGRTLVLAQPIIFKTPSNISAILLPNVDNLRPRCSRFFYSQLWDIFPGLVSISSLKQFCPGNPYIQTSGAPWYNSNITKWDITIKMVGCCLQKFKFMARTYPNIQIYIKAWKHGVLADFLVNYICSQVIE